MTQKFVHLHNHSDFSLLDGAASVKRLVEKAKELGMSHLALTDHGNMFGAIAFYRSATAAGIRPIIGCEVYIYPPSRFEQKADEKYYHMILLAKNNTGYKNLMKLVSAGYLEGFYYRPRIDDQILAQYREGLICSSACIAGEIPRLILAGEREKAKERALFYKNLFGDDFYLEVMNHGIEEEARANEGIFELAAELDISVIATNDIHYVEAEDYNAQDTLICIGTKQLKREAEERAENNEGKPGRRKQSETSSRFEFKQHEFYFKTAEQMAALFPDHPEVLENTVRLAEKCSCEIEFPGGILPDYPIPEKYATAEDYVRDLTYRGLKERYREVTDEIRQRADYELSVIFDIGGKSFAGYFLIVWDFITYARTHSIPVGPGRGSGAGSIVAYAMKITDIDPLKYDLLFERFLNPERVSMPDFDIDFSDEGRDEVIEYVRRKYGSDRVASICTFITLSTKLVLTDVARVHNIPFDESKKATQLISEDLMPTHYYDKNGNEISAAVFEKLSGKGEEVFADKSKLTLQNAVKEIPEVQAVLRRETKSDGQPWSSEWNVVFKEAMVLEDMVRGVSTHACGMVIGLEPIAEYVPLYMDKSKGPASIATQYDAKYIEDCGLVKMDFLGLKTLTIIKNCLRLIRKSKPGFTEADIDENDGATFQMLCEGKSSCVFQFESGGMKKILREARPASIEDMIALNALYRPGPMDWIPVYIAYKHKQKPVFDNPQKAESFRRLEQLCRRCKALNDILQPTNMIPIYQEQIMKIGQSVAGFSLGEADLMRRAMGKKKLDVLMKTKAKFIKGAAETAGIDEADAEFLFEDIIKPFSGYGFNKSHAAAYSVLAYKTAYLKCRFPAEFMAANLTNEIGGAKEKMQLYLRETRSMGIEVLPPDINISEKAFTVDNGKIVYGIGGINGVGEIVVEHIQSVREQKGKFKSFIDFLQKVDLRICNNRVVSSLIYAGVFDSIENRPRAELAANAERMTAYVSKEKESFAGGQANLFGEADKETQLPPPEFEKTEEWSERDLLQHEKETLGFYASKHPLEKYRPLWEKATDFRTASLSLYESGRIFTVLGMINQMQRRRTQKGDDMLNFQIEDFDDSVPVVVFPRTYKITASQWESLGNDEIIMFKARLDKQGEKIQLIFDRFLQIDLNRIPKESLPKEVHIRFNPQYTQDNLMELRRTVMNQNGKNPVFLHVPTKTGEYILKAPDSMGISSDESLFDQISMYGFINSVWTV